MQLLTFLVFGRRGPNALVQCSALVGLLLVSASVLAREGLFVYQTPAYQGKPIPSQVVGENQMISGHIHAGFWTDGQGDFAMLQMNKDTRTLDNLRLGCGAAGTNGPIIWSANGAVADANQTFRIISADLSPHEANEVCPLDINNVMSLNSASSRRLLYVEFERDGVPHRGQLWSQKIRLTNRRFNSSANLSDQQLVGDAPLAPEFRRAYSTLRFEEYTGDLDVVRYGSAPTQARLELRCGLPGTDGPVIALLEPGVGLLSNADLTPTEGDPACGLTINNIASLLEALLRGRLYAQAYYENAEVATTRGQYLSPYPSF